MTDRELLERAAKAAGVVLDKSHHDGFDVLGNAVTDWHNGTKWNPLTDDGDAFRLGIAMDYFPCNVRTGRDTDAEAAERVRREIVMNAARLAR